MCTCLLVESVVNGNGEWKVKMLFGFHLWQSGAEQSIPFGRDPHSSVPCVAVFIADVVAIHNRESPRCCLLSLLRLSEALKDDFVRHVNIVKNKLFADYS